MASLFIIEAPGKRNELSNMLWHCGIRDVKVMATVGHLGTNPDKFIPLGVNAGYEETAYRLKPEKEKLAFEIEAAAKDANKIYIATDDDQEGDVIARDTLRFCISPDDHKKVLRLRLRALAVNEIKAAIAEATPFDPLSAAKGDARRVVDRLIGSLSSDQGAVGRVQGSALLMLQEQSPVIGVMTYTMKSFDDGGPWTAQVPVYAGQAIPDHSGVIDCLADVGKSAPCGLADHVMDYGDIVLSSSIALEASISETSSSLQRLYERGKMTYARSRDHAITPDAFKRVMAMAKINGAAFNPRLFKHVRNQTGEYAHESPNPLIVDVPLNRDFALLGFDDRVLVHVARQLVSCGVPAMLEQPRMMDLAELPRDIAMLNWRRVVPVGGVLWESKPADAGFKAWTPEQSLLHFMQKNELGRPSTLVNHVEKFLARSLVDESFELTQKGRDWSYTIGEIFGHQNISKMVEHYLDDNKKPAPEMVADIIEMCGLTEKIGSAVIQESDNDYEQTFEI